jgi:hypothetical protein
MRVFVSVVLLILFSACNSEVQNSQEISGVGDLAYTTEAPQASHIPFKVPVVPMQVSFGSEIIDLSDIDMRERFDRELVVNNFWHSNTLFYFKRANRWFPIMKKILEEENVPTDFVYLAVIESGLDQVTSPSGAKGFWQFMAGTAKDYNLIVNDEIDERYHVEKSTRAAANYLKHAYNQFGSWVLAAAAYNRGKAGIERDMEYQYGSNFFDLHLNHETSRYVFRILAVKHIMEHPEDFGFILTNEVLYPEIKVKTITVDSSVEDLPKWATENGVNLKIVKKLNPWIIKNSLTIRQDFPIELYLPDETEQLKPYKRS